MARETIHIGIDDTDSTRKGCTTYVAALLIERLEKLGVSFIDYPSLIRLCPNIPWKTRGNGALCLRIDCGMDSQDQVKDVVLSTLEQNSDIESPGTEPGVVFLHGKRVPKEIKTFAKRATAGIVTLKEALKLLKKYHGEALGFKNGRGIIGGLAAIGETFLGDHTYEILVYRTPRNYGRKRRVDEASILDMDKATAPYTFNNVDTEKRRVIITPRGPDPILFGIRGETPQIVKKAFQMVKPLEPIERWVIFRSNQGTDAHLQRVPSLKQVKPYSSIIVKAVVTVNPKMIRGKHVIFSAKDNCATVDFAAYEPSGVLNRVTRELIPGDEIEAIGSVRVPQKTKPLTVNLEKIRLLKLVQKICYRNPPCPTCGKRMKSMGKNKGFRCKKCGLREPRAQKVKVEMKRNIEVRLYVASARSQRHLTKPLTRYGLEKCYGTREKLLETWHWP